MNIQVRFHSYFRDLAGTSGFPVELPEGASLRQALDIVFLRAPAIAPMRRSALTAVGLDYQGPDHVLREGDEVSLFPPVQGG